MAVPDQMLSKPIDWRDQTYWPLLDDLQGNILKGHGRDHTLNHFLKFDPARIAQVKQQIRAIGTRTTSALRQLNEVDAFKSLGRPGSTCVFFMLTAAGYAKLGLEPPEGDAFRQGMAGRQLADPAGNTWEAHLRPGIDALLIVADDTDTMVANSAAAITRDFAANGISITGMDAGRAIRSKASAGEPKGRGIEHFGYVDGRSQPLMLAEEVEREESGGGTDKWDPRFGPLALAFVRDPHGTTSDSYGSFLIYRKLEQNVRRFKAQEEALAERLGLEEPDDERAGAMVVGRFEDGTPLILFDDEQDLALTPNNFNYDSDPGGLKCPIHAHVRKINPRHGDDEQRSHLMPRRGIPYGERSGPIDDPSHFPQIGVGLLFMAYNHDIERQFEVTQRFWANSHDFPDGSADGNDPIIGQPAGDTQKWHPEYGIPDSAATPFEFGLHVHMKGGEYFFAPSRGFIKGIGL